MRSGAFAETEGDAAAGADPALGSGGSDAGQGRIRCGDDREGGLWLAGHMQFVLKRIYDPAEPSDGYRALVDRLWPRGVSKERAELDEWAKDLAPSPDLRKQWHAAADDQWESFAVQYRHELATVTAPAVADFLQRMADHPTVTLLYAAHDPEHNHARVLLEVLTA